MSNPIQVGVVAEGRTDFIVIEAALRAILDGVPFVPTRLQPDGSVALGTIGQGWGGVYHWCKQAARRGAGRLSGYTLLFQQFDVVILHLDADVAGFTYRSASITRGTGWSWSHATS